MEYQALHIKQLTKAFGDKLVLDKLDLSIRKGDCFGLVGLNGIGKTTLIKIILNLLKADEGKVEILGVDSTEKNARKDLFFLPEKFMPSTLLKGKEFLSISLKFHGKTLDIDKAKELAEKLNFDHSYFDKKISSYSKGMAQKIGLIATFLSNTPLLILDEPMSGLDPKARIELKKLLLEYKNAGNTIFFSSHILTDVEELCDNIAILHDRHFHFIGSPADLKAKSDKGNLEEIFLEMILQPNNKAA